jgi:hypothetical protein
MAIYTNLTIDQGSDFSTDITVEDAAGNDADLTGYTAVGQIRKSYSSTTKYDFVCTIPYPTQGVVQIKLTNAVTDVMKAGRYVYDVEVLQGSSGAITRIVEGQLEITPGVTR